MLIGLISKNTIITNMNNLPNNKIELLYKEQIEPYLDKSGDCWLFTGYLHAKGYGQINVTKKYSGIPSVSASTHRVAFRHNYKRPIHDSLHVLHTCDVRNCCNPAHLYLGTHQDNMVDRSERNRVNRPIGSKNPKVKLTEQDVLGIYLSKDTKKELISHYKVGRSAIERIKQKLSWKELTDFYDELLIDSQRKLV